MNKPLFNINPLPTWIYDLQTLEILDVNKAAIEFFGFPRDEFLKLVLEDLMPKKEAVRLTNAHSKNNGAEGEIYIRISTHQKSNAKPIQLDIHGEQIVFNDRQSILLVGERATEKANEIDRLEQSKQRLLSLMQGSFDLVGIVDKEGFYTYKSPSSTAIAGIPPKDFIGKNAFEFIHPDDTERVLASFKKVTTEGRVVVEPFRAKNHKNEWRWLETVLTNQLDHPAVNGIIVNTRDITDKIEQEEKNIQTKKRYESLIENSMDCIVVLSPEGKPTFVSGAVKRILGYTPSEIMEMDIWELIHPEDVDGSAAALSKAMEQPGVSLKGYTSRLKHKNGSWRWVEPIITNLLHVPSVRGIVDNFRDVTEKIDREQKRKLLESVITNTNDAVLITEAEPLDEPGPRIIYVNEAFTKMTGYTAEEVIGKTPRILQGPDSDYKELKKLGKSIRKWEPYEITTINYKKNGDPFWINFTVTPVADEKGWFTHFIAIERDITESKLVEKQLIEAKEIAEENERKMNEAQKLARLGSWYYDVIHQKSEWSAETYNIWGLDPNMESIDLVDHEKLVHPRDWERFNAVINNAIEKGIPYKMELQLVRADGSYKTVNTIGEPIFDEHKKVIAFRGTTQDISDRISIENKLRTAKDKAEKSEYAMTQASNLAKIGYWAYNFTTDKLTWADYIYRLYGLNPEDDILSYEEAIMYFDIPSQEKITKATKELIQKGFSYDLELRMLNDNKEEFFIRKVAQPVYNDKNEVIGKRGVMQDITEGKYLQELNREVARMVKIGSWSVNLLENTVFWSDAMHEMHETDPASYVPNLEEGIKFYREDFRQMVRSEAEKAIETGDGWDFEAVIVTANKNEIWIRSIGNAEFINGKCVRLYGGLQDINERKKSENRLISLSQNLPGIIYEYHISPDGTDKLKNISGKVKEIWGFTAKELTENVNLVWTQIEAAGEIDKLQSSIRQSIETKSQWQSQIKYVMPKTGKLRTHLGFGTPMFLADGTIIFNSMILDITKEAQNELLLEQTSKIARIGSWEMDLVNQKGDIMYWSPMIKEILELDKDDQPTLKKGIEFHVGESQERIRHALDLLINEGIEFDEEILLRTAKGNERWCRAIGKIEVINNKHTRIYGSYQDINDKKVATLALEKSLKELQDYKFSLDQSAIIAFTDEKGIITYVNDNFCEISGYSRKDLIGKTHRIINAKHHSKAFFVDLWKTITAGNVWRGEIKNKAKDGSYYWVDTTIVPFLNEKNEPIKFLAIRFDISDRKIVEENLAATAERLHLATSTGNIGIWDWDVLNDQLIWDDTMFQIFGVEKNEFKVAFEAWEAKIHPDDIDEAKEEVQNALKGLSKFNTEFRVVKHDNSIRYVIGEAIVIRDEVSGEPIRMIGTNIDITERKKAEIEILKANERFEKVTEATNDAIWDWDIVNNTFYRSKAIERFFGKSAPKLFTNKEFWKDSFHLDDIDKIKSSIDNALSNPQTNNWEIGYRIFNDDGKMLYIKDQGVIIRDEKGKAIRMVGAMTDITDQKQSEEENKFKANLLKTVGQAAIATDLDGIVNYWNRAAETIYGWSREEAIGKNINILTPIDVNKEEVEEILAKLKSGKTWSGEFIAQKKDGTKFPVRVSNSPVYDEHNNLSGMIGISSDITQEVENKELLKQHTANLERYNEKLRKIAWTQSHVVRAPLARILGIINLIELQDGKVDNLLSWLKQLKISSKEMDEIVKKIVDEANQLDTE